MQIYMFIGGGDRDNGEIYYVPFFIQRSISSNDTRIDYLQSSSRRVYRWIRSTWPDLLALRVTSTLSHICYIDKHLRRGQPPYNFMLTSLTLIKWEYQINLFQRYARLSSDCLGLRKQGVSPPRTWLFLVKMTSAFNATTSNVDSYDYLFLLTQCHVYKHGDSTWTLLGASFMINHNFHCILKDFFISCSFCYYMPVLILIYS